jgi:OmpA-OmpF porin, OOP family
VLLSTRRGLRTKAALSTALVAHVASAQDATPVPGFELERLRLNGAAAHGLLVESADLLPQFGYRAALTLHYQKDPLVLTENGNRVAAVVSDRLGLHLSGAFSFADWLDVSLQMPVILMQAGQNLQDRGYSPVFSGVAAGTPWLGARVAPFQQTRGSAVDFSIGVALGFPIGSSTAFTRDSTVTAIPSIAIGRTLSSWLRIGGGVGAHIRGAQTLTQATSIKDEIGSVVSPSVILSTMGDGLRGELSARFDIPLTRTGFGGELDLGLRHPLFNMIEVYAVGGPGFMGLPGTPTFRVLAGVALAPRQASCVAGKPYEVAACPKLDLDGDGILNAADKCPSEAGISQRQGCRDIDTDRDGIFDLTDACVSTPGISQLNGCPDKDSDNDGIADSKDTCPAQVGVAAHRGCPEPDADGDGIVDASDACPSVAGLKASNGCPEPDTDKDGIVDRLDNCVTVAGVASNSGCPANEKRVASIGCGKIETKDKVYFQTAKANILPKSDVLLTQILQILKDHAELTKVTIGGHTDARGSRAYNKRLSEQRAAAVRQWLIGHGIAEGRLASEGFGPDKPIASNDTDAGREQNRRVEFITSGGDCPAQ